MSASKLLDSRGGAVGTVLLLPGMALNASIFPVLTAQTVEVDFNDFQPNGRARDGSTRPGVGNRWMRAYIGELDRRLERSPWRDATRRIVVGHSFGGMLALAWWLHHRGAGPARIDGLVLAATTAGPMYDAVELRLLPSRLDGDLRVGITPLMSLWNSRFVTRAIHRVLSGGRRRQIDFQQLRGRSDLAVALAGWRATAWPARRGYRLAMWGFDARPRLQEIDVPTIVLAGTRDYLFRLERAHELTRGIPCAELRVIRGAGHLVPLKQGEEIVRAVEDLLG